MDLYHRLSVFPITVPSLRERGKDVLLLAGHFLEQNRIRLGLRGIRLSPEASHLLMQYNWPGNVRELEHIISRAALKIVASKINRNEIATLEARYLDIHPSFNTSDQTITHSELTKQSPVSPSSELKTATVTTPSLGALKPLLQEFEYTLIKTALEHTNYHWTAAAKILDIDASNLHKLAKKLGLKE
jgi:anaerobic nitric oxide reductase transcription regulator